MQLTRLGLSDGALRRLRALKEKSPSSVGFEAAAEELYRAAKGEDRKAFASALRNVLRVSQEDTNEDD